MIGFEPGSSGMGSNCAVKCVPQPLPLTIFNPQPFTVAANRNLIVDSGSDKMFV